VWVWEDGKVEADVLQFSLPVEGMAEEEWKERVKRRGQVRLTA